MASANENGVGSSLSNGGIRSGVIHDVSSEVEPHSRTRKRSENQGRHHLAPGYLAFTVSAVRRFVLEFNPPVHMPCMWPLSW